MNRNSNAHFSDLPRADIRRSRMFKNFSHKFSGNVGDVIPIYVDPDILPGDTVSIDTSKVIRFQTMLSPMMDNIYADIMFFFVPHRLVWDHWINLMGENTDSAWIPETEYSAPQIKVPPTGTGSNNKRGTILDYLGYPVEMPQTGDVEVSALPVRAYAKACLDWFTNENLTDPINLYTGDATVTATTESSYIDDVPHGGLPFKAGKLRDYFTSCLPSPQKGSPVELPIQQYAPVGTLADDWTDTNLGTAQLRFHDMNGSIAAGTNHYVMGYKDTALDQFRIFAKQSAESSVGTPSPISPSNLYADLSLATAVTVNDLRFAFQLQKLLERDARSGSRYVETIRSHFGVDVGDARLQRSEYLGGNRFPVTVNQIANTAQTSDDPLGDLGAYSCTVDVHGDFTKSFVEHGTLLGVMVLRYDHSYSQGLLPYWKRKSRFDFYWPVFANLGEMPVAKDELYLGASGTFGFQEAWASYRYAPNRLSGLMRPYLSQSLSAWTLGDDYAAAPSLSDSWFREEKANVDRTLAVTSQISDQFWADVYFKATYVRPMPVYSVPGLIDHF